MFCGSKEVTKEHLWPQWILKLVPDRDPRELSTVSVSGHDRADRAFQARLFELTAKAVCEACNTGWMSDVENAAKHFISGMIVGRGRQLHAGGQTALAAWAVLKTMMLQQVHPQEPLIPAMAFAELYEAEGKQPPKTIRVFTARSAATAWPGHYAQRGLAKDGAAADNAEAYMSTFLVFHLVVQVFGLTSGDEPGALGHPAGVQQAIRQIWPPTDSFTWPPGPSLSQAGVQLLCGPAVE